MTDVWHRPAWYDQAACQGMPLDLFFHEHNQTAEGRAVCQTCPVQAQCLEHGMTERHGLWGGLSERQRERLRGRRRR